MKALIYDPNKPEQNFLSLKEVSDLKINSKQALIKVLGVGICGSDLLKLDRALVKPGTVLGHEMVGELVELGQDLQNYDYQVGDRIVSSHHIPACSANFVSTVKKASALNSKVQTSNQVLFVSTSY